MVGIAAYVALAFVVMLAVCAITGGALARAGRGGAELRRDLRMHSALDEGNDGRPCSPVD